MKRICVLFLLTVMSGWCFAQAPFKVLYSNDTTHICGCISPYHQAGEAFTADMLRASVDETAGTGVEVHMLQPGLGWVPWWQSTVYPDAYQWFQQTYQVTPDSYGQYMLSGGDMVAVFVQRCRQQGLSPFISYRLNDAHGKEYVDDAPGTVPGWAGHALSRFYEEHPEYRIGSDINDWYERVQDWSIAAVREHKYDFIEEICVNYDIDGLELDFMRMCSLFNVDNTTSTQRKNIITAFIGQIRQLLDNTSATGQHRWLCVRVPCYIEAFDNLGINLPEMVTAGVDMVNISSYFFTDQQADIAAIVQSIPTTPVYLEMTGCILTVDQLPNSGGYDDFTFKRTTEEQFYTTAHLAYSSGAQGVSLFNFPYYREHGTPGRGPFSEPPFHIIEHLDDAAFLAGQNQHYILAGIWDSPRLNDRQLPKTFNAGQTKTFTMAMAAPAGGWQLQAKLRIEGRESISGNTWQVKFNGNLLNENSDVSEPYYNYYPSALGEPEQYRAWSIPKEYLVTGDNTIEVKMLSGSSAEIIFIDVAAEVVEEKLAFELNATAPGEEPLEQWQPVVGTGQGTLIAIGPEGQKPKPMSEQVGEDEHIWYYHFTNETDGTNEGTSAGYAAGYAFEHDGDMKLDPRKNYTFEAWIRRDLPYAQGNWGENIIGNYGMYTGCGWGFQTYGLAGAWARTAVRMRDNAGSVVYHQRGRSNSFEWVDESAWHHIVFVWDGEDTSGLTTAKTFLDGVNNFADCESTTAITADYWLGNEEIFGQNEVRVGAAWHSSYVKDNMWFSGDIAQIRIYTYCLNEADILANYQAGPPVAAEMFATCTEAIDADFDDNCQVDIDDLYIMIEHWLECNQENYFDN